MPVYTIGTPDGRKLKIEAADEQTALRGAQEWGESQRQGGGMLQTGQDAQQGIARGLTAGFSDEIFAAGMTPFEMARGAIRGTDEGKGIGQRVTDAYSRALDFNRQFEREAQGRSPVAFGAGEIGGGVMLPAGTMRTGATLGQQALRGAKVGAAYGGAYGVGTGETLLERAVGGLTGVLGGGALGAIAPVATEGVVRGVGKVAAPFVQAFRGTRDPEAEAARRVTSALTRDGQPPMPAQQFHSERAAGTPVTLMEMGGETTRALARSAANTSQEGRNALTEMTSERFRTQAPRIAQWFEDNFKVKLTSDAMDALQSQARKQNAGAYAKAYQEGADNLWSPTLERLAGSPSVTSAIKGAVTRGQDRAVNEGFGAFRPGVTITQDGRVVFNRKPDGTPAYPNLQFWDYVGRELKDVADAAMRAGRKEEAATVGQLRSNLIGELDRLVPSFGKARAGAAKYFGKQDALEAGAEFATMKLDPREAEKSLAKLSPQERKLFETGFVSNLVNKIRESPDQRSVLNQIATSPNARKRIELVIGPQKAREFEARLQVEGLMDQARKAVQGNSTTARQLAEMGLAGGAVSYGGLSVYNQDPTSLAQSALVAALVVGRRKIDQRVAEQVAKLLTSNDPTLLMRGFRIVSNNQQMLNALRAAEIRLAAPAAQQGPRPPQANEQSLSVQ